MGGGSFGTVVILPQAMGDPHQELIVDEGVGGVGGGSFGPVVIKPQAMGDPHQGGTVDEKVGRSVGVLLGVWK